MTKEEKILLSLLKHALTDDSWDESDSFEAVLALCGKHKVAPLLYDLAEKHCNPIPGSIKAESEKSVQRFWHLFSETKKLCDLLEENNIQVVVLKGISAARFYPIMEYRKSGDIDLLIRKEDMGISERLLANNGYQQSEEQNALHHISFSGQSGIHVEVHTLFTEPFDNKAANKSLEYYSAEALNHVNHEEIEGVVFPLLQDDYQALSLILHMLHHYLRAGFGLKLLTDWVVFWNIRYSLLFAEQYLSMVKDIGIDGFSDLVSSVCVYYLGLNKVNMPGKLMDSDVSEKFIDDVLKGGEFGYSSRERMVSLRSGKAVDYIREFHHQTCLNFPVASKFFVNWPVLWIITFCRFIDNNRRIRKTTLLKVLKSAGERGQISESIHLFSSSTEEKNDFQNLCE